MNVSYRSRDWRERILSNLARTPFTIVIRGETFRCASVEGFWQGLKCRGHMREHVFMLDGPKAKAAGRGKRGEWFEIAGQSVRVGSAEHEALIRKAILQKILQNPKAEQALKESRGTITHRVSARTRPIFKMEKLLMAVRKERFGY